MTTTHMKHTPMKAALTTLLAGLLPFAVNAAPFAQTRVSVPDFEQVMPQDAFTRVARAGGVTLVLEGCPVNPALVSASGVSGRLPVVIDRLVAGLGCAWSESNGVVTVRGVQAGAPERPIASPTRMSPSSTPANGGAPAVLATPKGPPAPVSAAPTIPADTVAQKPAEKAAEKPDSSVKPAAPSITLRLAGSDIPTYALRDFLVSHGMSLIWGAGDVASVATVPGDYSGDSALAVVNTLLRAHGLSGIYAHSNKTLYVR